MAKPAKKEFIAYVKVNALINFNVHAETAESALERAREELKELDLFSSGIEYCDGNTNVCGVMEAD